MDMNVEDGTQLLLKTLLDGQKELTQKITTLEVEIRVVSNKIKTLTEDKGWVKNNVSRLNKKEKAGLLIAGVGLLGTNIFVFIEKIVLAVAKGLSYINS